ncbi:MAG: S8 family serine peptidase [Candidatus Acidiferrales bacterium]
MVGQRKHTTWNRDRNRNFIDDEIEKRFRRGEIVDIIVDTNKCLRADQIRAAFSPYGKISYIGKLITFVLLENVRVDDLPKLAAHPDVAMIEWQETEFIVNDVSTRAIQARTSNTFSPNTAQDAGFTGNGVTIAILDTGVDDGANRHEAFPAAKFVAGFDATIFEDTNGNGIDDSCEPAPLGNGVCTDADDEPANGTTNPTDNNNHGTHVAGSALGNGTAGRQCSNPDDNSATNCAGVASAARLVDIRRCTANGTCPAADRAEAMDWLGLNAAQFNIRVASMSIGSCTDDDGTSASAQLVNYVVALGVAFAVAHGNAGNCNLAPGTQRTGAPGSASFAITVGGTNDQNTVTRNDDVNYSGFLIGPRNDFNVAAPNLLALKPDISAPGEAIISAQRNTVSTYFSNSGTSMATPHVAGAAALIIQARPTIDPGSLKDLLKRNADTSNNVAQFPAVDPNWDTGFGAGMLNVFAALAASTTDVRFPNCVGAGSAPGQPCALTPPMPAWNNTADISTAAAPKVGTANTITAQVRNNGGVAATVLVNFGVYVFAVGNNQFFHIGTQQVTIPPMTTMAVNQPWTPASANHQCVQIGIDFGLDTDHTNNVTQRNLQVAPSVYEVQIENPFMVPAAIQIEAKSDRVGWTCRVSDTSFTIDPLQDCPRQIKVTFDPPAGARPGERANCNIGVTATPRGTDRARPIGGVTVQTFVPRPCRIVGVVVDAKGNPLAGARLTFRRAVASTAENAAQQVAAPAERPVTTIADAEGIFSLRATPFVAQLVTIEKPGLGSGTLAVRLECGTAKFKLMLTPDGPRLVFDP